MNPETPPVVLSFSALDPSGRGGIQADIETIASLGGHCAPVVTALCTTGVAETAETISVNTTVLIAQARSILEDMSVKAIKIGFPGSVAVAEAIHSILQDYRHIPVIFHPAFCLWDPNETEQANLPAAITALLLPLTEVHVATQEEAHTLVKEADTDDATAQALMSGGCQHLLLNRNDPQKRQFHASLYDKKGLVKHSEWNQAIPTCHGAASTLASAIAVLRGHDCHVQAAVEQAQNFTWQAMSHARQLGFGKPTPYRFFWTDETIEGNTGKATH